MKPMIDQAFWSDPDIEARDPSLKLAALWLMTNSQTSMLGVCGATERRFTFETGLAAATLNAVIEAMPQAFSRFGDMIFLRNYVRHQFGTGEKLTRNNFFVALKSLFRAIKDEKLQSAILKEYPEFSEALTKGLPRAYQAQVKERKGKDGEGKQLPEPDDALTSVDGFSDQWAEFIQHRKEIRKPLTPLAARNILASLGERSSNAVAALDMAIRRGWQGFEWGWFDREQPKQPGTDKPQAFNQPMNRPPERPDHAK